MHAEIPFAKNAAHVAGAFQHARQQHLARVHATDALESGLVFARLVLITVIGRLVADHVVNAIALRITAGKQRAARRRARRPGDVKTVKLDSAPGQAVEVRRLYFAGTKAAEVAIALVVRDNEQNIRLGQGVGGGSQAQREYDGKLATSHLLGRQTVRAAKPAFKFSVARLLRRFCWPSGGSSERLPPLRGSQSAA